MLVFHVGREYDRTVQVLSYSYVAAYDLHATGQYENEGFHGKNSVAAAKTLEGDWVNNADASTLRIKSNNAFFEIRSGIVRSSGSWLLRDSLSGTPFADKPKGLYLQQNKLDNDGLEQIVYFQISTLNNRNLDMTSLSDGNSLSFVKKSAKESQVAE